MPNNIGAFGENFPYSNFHDFNMDWIIKIAKDFLDQYTLIQNIITNGETSLNTIITDGIASLGEKATELEGLLDQWYNTHSSDIANQLTEALASIQTTLLTAINTFGTQADAKAETTIASIPSDYSTFYASFNKMLNALMYNVPADVIDYCSREDGTLYGITWTWVGDTAHITGRATQATGSNMFASTTTLPTWLIPGQKYSIKMNSTLVFLEIFDYSNGSTTQLLRTNSDTVWTCPSITGAIIRWRINDTTTNINEYITPRIILIPEFNSQFKGTISYITYPNGDLNDFTDVGWYSVDCQNIDNTPLSQGIGIMEVIGNIPIIIQRFTFITGLSYQRYINTNAGTQSAWEAVKLLDPMYRTSSLDTGDLNTLTATQYKFISSPNTVTNLPEQGAGFLIVYYMASTGIILQEYFTYNGLKHYARQKTGNTWSNWVRVSGSEGGTITNTYNITTSPTITTDTNNWLNAIDNEETAENNATDMTGAIMSMLTDTGYCKLSEGTFYVSGNIDMPAGSSIEGCGHNTIIRLLSSVSDGYVIKATNNNTINNLRISGSKNNPSFIEPSKRHGIYFVSDRGDGDTTLVYHSIVNNVWIENFNGSGIYCFRTGGGIREGLVCSNLMIDYCKYGINIALFSEYHKFTNVVIFRCDIACSNGGGNNSFNNCTFNGNTGFLIDNSNGTLTNEGHGTCTNCCFNHIGDNTGNAVEIINNPVTFQFVGCQFWYGKIVIRRSKGIMFDGCSYGGNPEIICSDNTIVLMNSGMFYQNPTIQTSPNGGLVMANCYLTSTGERI